MSQIELVVFQGPVGIVEAAGLWLIVVVLIAGLVAGVFIVARRMRQKRSAPPDDWQEDRP
ncbi:MAG: hypothetical protein J2P38_01690 [Candidatus Dormibacteraeota bacterium]|nr:hypothetical protein [Candidatus Dormibacteraeota bacterium]